MMKRGDSKSIGSATSVGCVVLLLCIAGAGYCEENGAALMLEISPVSSGTLNLPPGVHTYDRDAEVTLIAVPNPGYQFVYWLGDVADAASSNTMVYLDSPKIVIAVFERSKFEFVTREENPQMSRGGGGLIPSGGDYARGGISPVAGKRFSSPSRPKPPEPPEEEEADLPVPEEEPDFPVPTPEPATVCLLGIGGLTLLCKRHKEFTSKRK